MEKGEGRERGRGGRGGKGGERGGGESEKRVIDAGHKKAICVL